jgi:hypothetical protein
MLFALSFLGGSALLGVYVVRALMRDRLDAAEQLLWGIVVGWTISTTAIYLLARLQGRITRALVVWVTIVICIPAVVLSVRSLRRRRVRLRWPQRYNGLILLLCLFTPVYWNLFSSHFFARGVNGIYSGGSAFADLSFHAAVSTSFLFGNNFPPTYTPHFADPMLYPFMPDFQTAVLMAVGLSMRSALMITSLTLALVSTGLIFYLAIRIFGDQIVGIMTAILFLLNGGLGFIDLVRDWLNGPKSFLQFWNSMEVNYANYSLHGLHWPNIIADGFVAQRTSLFGVPLAMIVLTVFAAEWRRSNSTTTTESGDEWSSRRMLLFAGVLTGLLPLFHVHSFIAVGLISGFLFLLRPRRSWLWFWLPAVLIAAAPISNLLLHASQGGIVRLQPGWMGHSETFWPLYILRNLGLPLLLAIPAWFAVDRVWRKFYLAFACLLAFTLIVVVSPNIFDNGKLIYYWHALNSVLIANWLVRLSFINRQTLIATVLGLLCIATGISAVHSESLQSSLQFTDEDVAAADFVIAQTQPKALFLTAPITNQPILALAGRRIVRGPTAWLWSHGHEFRDREADVRRIYKGSTDARDLLAYYGIDYIFLGDAEKSQLKAHAEFFDANFRIAYRGPTITIYDSRNVKNDLTALQTRELRKLATYDPFALLVEFPRTSFFIYRSWLVSKSRIPAKEEFNQAISLLGRNLFIGGGGWEQQLETNRMELVRQLSESEEFSAKSNAEYLSTLFANARLTGDNVLEKQLLEKLDNQTETRASVLTKVIEHATLFKREYNTAFVLVHYFGYLNRNPSDAPDSSLEGFQHWRKILDESGDYRSVSRAFLESDEYQKR